ncbi:hypothetical protein GCM10009096_30420 [Parasphingorhabdus litoris]|uniref:TraB/GumN family protein n=1 Tax=Parasphingorhabdus litoris TaxID=394733 RepID=A0ABN1AWZ5_9SPHN|nr:hypothetical protein [Parasphingorhabdus litoris]
MTVFRLSLFKWSLFGCLAFIAACSAPAEQSVPSSDANIVTIVGAIHGQHRRSTVFSLDVLRAAITKFDPDIVMVELPTERYAKASANYEKFGEVRESRADDFPELTGVIFPLQQDLGFEMIPVAAWTQKIADDRRAALVKLENDPARAKDWAAHQVANQAYSRAVSGRSDDPIFIHSEAYDKAVKLRQETYEALFGNDLGPGGWKNINAAHYAMISEALDGLKGQQKRILILYGAWHKYWFLEQLERRGDIQLIDGATLFAD